MKDKAQFFISESDDLTVNYFSLNKTQISSICANLYFVYGKPIIHGVSYHGLGPTDDCKKGFSIHFNKQYFFAGLFPKLNTTDLEPILPLTLSSSSLEEKAADHTSLTPTEIEDTLLQLAAYFKTTMRPYDGGIVNKCDEFTKLLVDFLANKLAIAPKRIRRENKLECLLINHAIDLDKAACQSLNAKPAVLDQPSFDFMGNGFIQVNFYHLTAKQICELVAVYQSYYGNEIIPAVFSRTLFEDRSSDHEIHKGFTLYLKADLLLKKVFLNLFNEQGKQPKKATVLPTYSTIKYPFIVYGKFIPDFLTRDALKAAHIAELYSQPQASRIGMFDTVNEDKNTQSVENKLQQQSIFASCTIM